MISHPAKQQKGDVNHYMPALDGLRFLAFVLVFCHHHEFLSRVPGLSVLYTHGWIGVDIFFVLSAYLLAHLLSAEFRLTNAISIRKFYLRRIFRIWPLYVSFVVFLIVLHLSPGSGFTGEMLSRIAGLFTLSDNILTAAHGYNPLLFAKHLWTIAYEEQFYLAIPLVVLWVMRWRGRFGIILFVAVLLLFNVIRLWFIAAQVQHPAIWVLPVTHFESILFGVALGMGGLDFLTRKVNPALALVFACLMFVVVVLMPPVDQIGYHLVITYTCVGACASMLLYGVLRSKWLTGIFSAPALTFLGKRSYGLYVFHLLGIGAGEFLVRHVDGLPSGAFAEFIYALLVTLSAAVLSYKFIEAPVLQWKRKFEIVSSRPV